MKKIITTALLTGSLMSIFGVTTLFADQAQTIDQKAKVIIHDATLKADKLVEDAKATAKEMIEKAKEDASALRKESAQSMKETSAETKALASEALEKAKAKGHQIVEKTKAMPQVIKQGIEDKYVYTKETVNESYEKGKDSINDTLIHGAIKYAFLVSEDVHSMKINVDVKDGVVELFGKVKSSQEAEKAIQIASSTKGVWAVNAFFVIR